MPVIRIEYSVNDRAVFNPLAPLGVKSCDKIGGTCDKPCPGEGETEIFLGIIQTLLEMILSSKILHCLVIAEVEASKGKMEVKHGIKPKQ